MVTSAGLPSKRMTRDSWTRPILAPLLRSSSGERRDQPVVATPLEMRYVSGCPYFGWSSALTSRSELRLGVARAFDAGHVSGATDTAGFVSLSLR